MKIRNSLLSILLVMTLVFGLMPMAAAADAATFPDMPADGYWSTEALKNAVANGILQGTPEGKILPKSPLTRAQMATVMARAFGATVKGDLSGFKDVPQLAWYADAIAQAYQMGILQGSGTKMNPQANITRQEVFTIVARAFKLQPAETISKTFSDTDQIASWAKGSIYALVNAGYIEGSNGKLNPNGLITREEFATVFDRLLEQYIKEAGVVTEVVKGNIMINAPGVTLKDLTVSGDLILGDGVGDGDVILENVTVTGRLVVRGGGVNSIVIRGTSNIGNVIVARVDGAVSVKVQDGAEVDVIYIDDGSDDVVIQGTIGALEIAASDVTVTASGAQIGTATVVGQNTNLIVDEKSTITALNVKDEAENIGVEVKGTVSTVTTAGTNTAISGTGTVTTVVAAAGSSGTKVETPKTRIVAETGSSAVTGGGGKAVDPGTTASNNNDGTDVTAPPPVGPGPVVVPDKKLRVYIQSDAGNAEFLYTYAPTAPVDSVIAGFAADNATKQLLKNLLDNALGKAQGKGLITDAGVINTFTVGVTQVNPYDILSNAYKKAEDKANDLFASGSALTAYLDSINPANLFTTSGQAGLKSTGTYSTTNAADFYAVELLKQVTASFGLIKNVQPKGSYDIANVLAAKLCDDFISASTASLSGAPTTIDQAKLANAIRAIRQGTVNIPALITELGFDTLTLTVDYPYIHTLLTKELEGVTLGEKPIAEVLNALNATYDLQSYSITITISLDYAS